MNPMLHFVFFYCLRRKKSIFVQNGVFAVWIKANFTQVRQFFSICPLRILSNFSFEHAFNDLNHYKEKSPFSTLTAIQQNVICVRGISHDWRHDLRASLCAHIFRFYFPLIFTWGKKEQDKYIYLSIEILRNTLYSAIAISIRGKIGKKVIQEFAGRTFISFHPVIHCIQDTRNSRFFLSSIDIIFLSDSNCSTTLNFIARKPTHLHCFHIKDIFREDLVPHRLAIVSLTWLYILMQHHLYRFKVI